MKPLLSAKSNELLARIDNAIDGEIQSITINSPVNMTIELSVQDTNRGNDWINIAFEIDGVCDARLVDESKLMFVDMGKGITIVFEDGNCGLAVGEYITLEALKDATLYLIGTSLKYEERPFSG